MSKLERGMVKWAPYKSLVEQATYLAKMRNEKNKVDKPRISSDQADDINRILTEYSGERVYAKYWKNGYIYEVYGQIDKIETYERYIVVDETRIYLSSLFCLTIEESN